MRKIAYIIYLIFILVIVVPLIILQSCNSPVVDNDKKTEVNQIKGTLVIKVFLHEQSKVVSMELEEYLKGVVAAEMPANFELEALKAQAVAARTYAVSKIIKHQEDVLQAHKGGDICTDFTHCQAWRSKEQLKDIWGIVNFSEYYNKITKAIEDTNGLLAVYNGEIINPLYHSTSGGKTENSEEVFSAKLPYLRSVVSLGEEASPKYTSKTVVSKNDFKKKLVSIYHDFTIDSKMKNIKVLEFSTGERVKKIQIGNKVLEGKDIRNIFSLNSSNFIISIEKENVVFTTQGYGHGVGMSQFGANYLAKEGRRFEDILKYYYQGIQISDIKHTSIKKQS